jgi:hypothetical protein
MVQNTLPRWMKIYMGVEGKKFHDSQMQFSNRIIVAIIIIIRPSLVVKMMKHGCK